MKKEEVEEYIEKHYKISLDKIFKELNPDGYLISREIHLFFDKLNSLYEVEEKLNLEMFIKFQYEIDNLCSYDFHVDFVREQWSEVVVTYMPKRKIEAFRELSYFAFNCATYWEKLNVLEFSLIHLDKNEKIIKSHIFKISSLVLNDWSDRDENWKKFTEKFLKILKDKFKNNQEIDEIVNKLKKVLLNYSDSLESKN
jgi:hypothetical protein